MNHPSGAIVEATQPASREEWLAARTGSIGGSEIAALFGAHPWLTPYHLWALKTGRMEPGPDTVAAHRGRKLEAFVLSDFASDHPEWAITPNPVPGGGRFYRFRDRPQSATPDGFAIRTEYMAEGSVPRGGLAYRGVCQVKTVNGADFARDWMATGTAVAPAHIAIQVQAEMAVTGTPFALLLALCVGYGYEVHAIEIERDEAVIATIAEVIDEFWPYVERDLIPPLNFDRDLPAIKAVHRASGRDPDDVVDLGDNRAVIHACEVLADVRHDLKLLEAEKDRHEAFIRATLGDHTAAIAGGFRITAKHQIRKASVMSESASRPLRITFREEPS